MTTEDNRNHVNRRSALGTIGALGALAVAPQAARAQQGDANWQRIVAAAKKEGSLVIYHQAVPLVLDRVTKDFMAQYPEIKVEYRRLLTPVTHMQAIEAEKAGKLDGADITQYANAIWYRDKAQENFFLKPAGPATADYPKENLLYGAVATVAVMPFVMAYNTNLVKTPLTSMRDLLKPEFRGKVGSSISWRKRCMRSTSGSRRHRVRTSCPSSPHKSPSLPWVCCRCSRASPPVSSPRVCMASMRSPTR